jgi:hypothetical protein
MSYSMSCSDLMTVIKRLDFEGLLCPSIIHLAINRGLSRLKAKKSALQKVLTFFWHGSSAERKLIFSFAALRAFKSFQSTSLNPIFEHEKFTRNSEQFVLAPRSAFIYF